MTTNNDDEYIDSDSARAKRTESAEAPPSPESHPPERDASPVLADSEREEEDDE